MEDNTIGLVVVTIIGLLYFIGIGSLILSFIYDPKEPTSLIIEKSPQHSVVSSYRSFVTEEDEASVILEEDNKNTETFDFDFKVD